jgi:hypothetical protein
VRKFDKIIFLFQAFLYNGRFVWRSIFMHHATTWNHGDMLVIDGFWNISLIYEGLGIYRFNLWYSNLNCGTLIGKEKLHTFPFWRSWCLNYAKSSTSFGWPYFVMHLSLGLIKVKPRLIASHYICERWIVVFRELFQQMLGNS